MKYKKSLIWLIVVCFAWLQLLSPLLHAHSDSSNKQANIGVHFHVDYLPKMADTVPALKNINAHGDVVNIEASVIRDEVVPLFLAILVTFFSLPLLQKQRFRPTFTYVIQTYQHLYYSCLVPRAPPHF